MSNEINSTNKIEVKSTKEAFFPHPTRTKGQSSKAGLIFLLVILGLLVGAGIAAGTIHAIQPLDGSNTNTTTIIETVYFYTFS